LSTPDPDGCVFNGCLARLVLARGGSERPTGASPQRVAQRMAAKLPRNFSAMRGAGGLANQAWPVTGISRGAAHAAPGWKVKT